MAKTPPKKRPKTNSSKTPRQHPAGQMPTREDILEALANEPGLKGKRDLARVFGVRGDMRVPFKALLKEMEDEGLVARKGKSVRRAAELPSVTVLDIPTEADPDALIAFPASWNEEEDGDRPLVVIEAQRNARVVPGPGDRILARISRDDAMPPRYTARTMKILDKPRRGQIGIVRMDNEGARLIPVDRKQKEMRIPVGDLGDAKDGDLVEVDVKLSGRMMLPRARVTNVIGNPHSEGAISLIALHNLEIPYHFPASVLAESEAVKEVGIKGREDWRDMPFVTIDPATAKDHDDAVYAHADDDVKNPDGHVVYVAIADVAAYITPGSVLDKEAYMRGNSVYFPDRVVPMLPERISNDLCSLREGENRPALGLRMVFDANGHKKNHSFHRVIIRSAAKLAYEQAQAAINGKPDDKSGPLLEKVLKPLWAAYSAMTTARDKRAPLALDLPERRIELNPDGTVARVTVPERLDAHKLIEEMMIAANVAAAETLEQQAMPLLYRVHDVPGREKLIALREFLSSMKMSFSKSDAVRPSHFNEVLRKAKDTDSSEQVSSMVLRSQAQAVYSAENFGHFGLNLDRYAHFTSPIRRYADLIVHRALIAALKLGKDGLKPETYAALPSIAQHISDTERRAMVAERETNDRLLAEFMSAKIGAQFDGRISGVTKSGLFVRLADTGADGFIPASTLGQDYYRYVEEQQAMIGERTGERFRLGDTVKVRLLEAAPLAGALRFELLSEGDRVTPLRRGGPRNKPKPHRGKRRKR